MYPNFRFNNYTYGNILIVFQYMESNFTTKLFKPNTLLNSPWGIRRGYPVAVKTGFAF
jgi:hypothetical protein